MKLIIDRIEGEYVVCENQETKEILNLDRTYFPSNAKDGDLIEFADGLVTILDNTEIKSRIQRKMNNLWK